jgi:hypothetical protein
VGRGCGGTGRFLHCVEEGGSWERWRVQKDTGSEPKASDGQTVSLKSSRAMISRCTSDAPS